MNESSNLSDFAITPPTGPAAQHEYFGLDFLSTQNDYNDIEDGDSNDEDSVLDSVEENIFSDAYSESSLADSDHTRDTASTGGIKVQVRRNSSFTGGNTPDSRKRSSSVASMELVQSINAMEAEMHMIQKAHHHPDAHHSKRNHRGGKIGITDHINYFLENSITNSGSFQFITLLTLVGGLILLFGLLWQSIGRNASESADIYANNFGNSIYAIVQILITGAFMDQLPERSDIKVLLIIVSMVGFIMLTLILAFVTESVTSLMQKYKEGHTKVLEKNHTLILGFNEATPRVITQISFIRRAYQKVNEKKFFHLLYYFPILSGIFKYFDWLERPTTSLANSNIVILCNSKTKEQMHTALLNTLIERGISAQRTSIGKNIICRVGDPTSVHHLLRVGVHQASAVLLHLPHEDAVDHQENKGEVNNGATLRTLLAIRYCLNTHRYSPRLNINPDLRIVIQLSSPSYYIDAACFTDSNGRNIVYPLDLSLFSNAMLFNTAVYPGMARIFTGLLDFERTSFRRRFAKNLRGGPDGKYGYFIGKKFSDVHYEYTKAIFVGIIKPRITDHDRNVSEGLGLCPDMNTIVEQDDLLVFIGPKPTPTHSIEMHNRNKRYSVDADNMLQMIRERNEREGINMSDVDLIEKRCILVFGWKKSWESLSRDVIHSRILYIAKYSRDGSIMVFVNNVNQETFKRLIIDRVGAEAMDTPDQDNDNSNNGDSDNNGNGDYNVSKKDGKNQKDFIKVDDGTYYQLKREDGRSLTIIHQRGDATDIRIIEPLVYENNVNTAIVLGTGQQSEDITSQAAQTKRDTRVLCIMLLLRKIWNIKHAQAERSHGVTVPPMHIIGENEEDLTEKLALGPRLIHNHRKHKRHMAEASKTLASLQHGNDKQHHLQRSPDFINSQAIIARALVQTLAYPMISTALEDLFSDHEGSAKLVIVKPHKFALLNQELCYGVVRHSVLLTPGERSILIGYIKSDVIHIAPRHGALVTFTEDDRLILLRKLLPQAKI